MVYRILYVSTARPWIDSSDLAAILQAARRNNTERGLTGMLLFTGRHFMQLLEGERDAVEGVMRAISLDSRHVALARLIAEPAPARACPDWAMAMFQRDHEGVPPGAVKVDDRTIQNVFPDTLPADLRMLFGGFRSVMGRTSEAA